MNSTGNDIESNDILDFEDNTVNLDILMNADQEYWTDRLGNKRPTIDYALRMAGFTPAGFDFTTGGVLKNGDRNKCVFNQADQTWYSWSGELPYNVIAGSVPGEGWKVVNKNLFLSPIKVFRAVDYHLSPDTNADNTEKLLHLFSDANNHTGYFEIDLQGGMYRIYSGNILTPLKLVGKKFTIKNGGFYAGDASVSPSIANFPSIVTFDKCEYTALNFTCFAKGEKWGNTDASHNLNYDDRAKWIAEKGGHAIAVIRSKYRHINVNAGLAGSVAAIYLPSSRGYAYGGNSYCSSLGYSAYNADTWCGRPSDVGIGDFIHVWDGVNAVPTEHKRPEDGVSVGNKSYCGKLGFLAEGESELDVQVYINGGRWVGFYANGVSMDLGAAFGSTSATLIAKNPIIGDAAAVIRIGNSSNSKATGRVYNVDAKKIGLCAIMVSNQSFGSVEGFLTGNVEIVADKVWTGSGVPELVNTSVIANRGVSIPVDITINANVYGLVSRFVHNFRACYGGIFITGGRYVVSDYIAYSKGWGGATPGTFKGFVCSGDPTFIVTSTDKTDEIFRWQDADDSNVGVYVYIDAENAKFISKKMRRIDFLTQLVPARREKFIFPRTLEKCYALTPDRPREVIEVKAISSGGPSGSNWAYKFAFIQGKPPLFPCSVVLNDEIRLVLSGSGNPSLDGEELTQTVFIQGAPSATAITVGNIYGFLGA